MPRMSTEQDKSETPDNPPSTTRANSEDLPLRDRGGRDSSANRKDKKPRGWVGWLKEIAIIVGVALVLSILIKTFLFRAFFVPSSSMENTLDIGDRIFVNQLVPQPFDLARGDIIVFEDKQGWLPPEQNTEKGFDAVLNNVAVFLGLAPDNSQQYLVKRVIGLPGDRVVCCSANGKLTVNGQEITEPYLKPGVTPSDVPFDVTVPEGSLWVMGDNRSGSADSRAHMTGQGQGFIREDDVVGAVGLIAFPFNRFGFVSNPSDTFRDVPAPAQPAPAP